MQTENFSLSLAKNMSFTDAKIYISKYFTPLYNGSHALLKDQKYEIIDDVILKKTYFARLSKEINAYYFHEIDVLKNVVYKINKDLFYDDNINLCPRLKHTYHPRTSFSEQTHKAVNLMLDFILEVICSGNTESRDFVVKWFANMARGNKNNSCIYLKGVQGLGKSTLPQFISKHVIGHDLCLESGSEPLKSKFNSILAGKLFVVFEELENVSTHEWSSMSSILKRYITSDKIVIEEKNKNSLETDNLNNIMIISNNDAIKDEDGRRFFIADLSTKKQGDHKYFKTLYDTCFNDVVGECFFSYLLDVNIENFNPQSFPMNNNKLDAISKRLDSVYQFLKDSFILRRKDINMSVQDLYDAYVESNEDKKKYNKIDFNKQLKTININHYKSNGVNKYKISSIDLLVIANKLNWIHELDEFDDIKAINEFNDETDFKSLYEALFIEHNKLKAKQSKKYLLDSNILDV